MGNVGPLLKETGDPVTQDSEKAKALNPFLASAFTSKTGLQELQVPEAWLKGWGKEDVPLVEEDQVREYLSKPNIHKSMGPDGMHPKMLRELADGIMRQLPIVFVQLWQMGEMPED